MREIEARLAARGITLPDAVTPIANYAPFVREGRRLYVSGQLSRHAAGDIKGTVGLDVDLETAKLGARYCAIQLMAQMKAAGVLERVRQIVKLGGFVQAGPEFYDIPAVINGCSDLLVEVFGDAGRHARSAVGVYKLPLNYAVEIDVVVELLDEN